MSNRNQSPDPMFSEPSFNEPQIPPDPTYFNVKHGDDKLIYDYIDAHKLASVQGFKKSRIADDQMFSLQEALGHLGPAKVKQIKDAGKIVFHSTGDAGSTRSTI